MAATIKQVAALADVSTATVSYVLNGTGTVTEATRQRVMDVVARLNYQPSHAARSMRGRSYTLGLTLPALPGRLADPALAELLSGLSDAAALRGYYLLLATPGAESEAELCMNLARTGRVDGLLLLDMQVEDERARALCEAKIPHACAGPAPAGCNSPFVLVDGRAGAATALQHLLGLGHRRVGLIQLPSELAESEPRYLGYTATLNDGETVFGVITAETGGGIRMKGLDGKERTLVRGSIQSLVSTNRSLMPDGLEAQISKQDLADLIRFLQTPQGK